MLGAGGFPASSPERRVVSLAAGAWRAARTPRPTPGASTAPPPAPALWHSRRRGAERQLSCSHFLIVVFEALGSRAERLTVPVPRLLEEGGRWRTMKEARLCAGAGRAPSAAARLVRRRRGSVGRRPLAPRAPGTSQPASQLSRRRGWRLHASLPDLTAAGRHGASPPDGPVSIPGGERVGSARRPLGTRRWRGRTAGSRTCGFRGPPRNQLLRGCAARREPGGEFSLLFACLRDDTPPPAR